MKISITLRLILALLLMAPASYGVDHIKRFRSNSIDIDLNSSIYNSDSNYYSNSGDLSALPYGGSYQLMDLEPSLRWMMNTRFAAYSMTNVSMAESHGYNATDGAYKKTNTTLSRLGVGAEYLLYDGTFEAIPEVRFVYPLETYSDSGNAVMNQEGALELLTQMTIQTEWGSLKPYTYLGVDYRDQGRAVLMPWGVGTEYKFLKSAMGGELGGFSSIVDDQDASNNTSRRLQSLNVNGGSFRFGAVNPMAINASLWFRFRIGSLMAKVYAVSSVAGGNYANGTEVGFLLRYMLNLGNKNSSKSSSEFIHTMEPNQEEMFKEDTSDGVDQKIFKVPTPAVAPSNYQMKKATPSNTENVDGEYQIKLKPLKKKNKKSRN